MANKTPSESTEKWQRNLKASVTDIQSGVNRVTEAPGKKAAAKASKMLANLTAKVNDGTWAKRVGSVSLDEWKSAMLDKGIGRIASGVDGASDKMQEFFSELFAHQDKIQSKLATMADLTLEDSISRMTTWVREMAKFKRGG